MSHNLAAQQYVATIWNKTVGFISVIHFPHPKLRNLKKIHRLVVLPDYQGIGIGRILLNTISGYYNKLGYIVGLITSHPALNKSLQYDEHWRMGRMGRMGRKLPHKSILNLNKTVSKNRLTCSWFYKNYAENSTKTA